MMLAMAAMSFRHMERIVKGFANHRRLEIMELLKKRPDLSVDEVASILKIGYENASDHLRKLAIAGLVMKRSRGPAVEHKLTKRAEDVLVFCKRLQ